MYVCVFVCVCVYDEERRGLKKKREKEGMHARVYMHVCAQRQRLRVVEDVCVCVFECVC